MGMEGTQSHRNRNRYNHCHTHWIQPTVGGGLGGVEWGCTGVGATLSCDALQRICPVPNWYMPAAHTLHAVAPRLAWCLPRGHAKHRPPPDLVRTLSRRVNVPEAHFTAHALPASVGARPAGQRVHRWSRMMWPAVQRHDAWSCAGTAPPLHAAQCSSPACFDTWPAVQRRQSVCPWCGLKRPA